jgi:hypothetical protein
MNIKINEADLLDLLGPNGEHWLQGDWGDDQQMCLHGAIRRCQPQPGDALLIEQVANRQGWGTGWNDDKATTWAQVRERLAHVEVTDADLADTFGPQWESIVALVRRAAVLTADEAQRLDAAWNAAWDAAWDAAGAAAWNAAEAAAWAAATANATGRSTAAGAAAWNAAEAAAWAAATANATGRSTAAGAADWAADWDADWAAAGAAAGAAAWNAAEAAAWAAARALAVRDLIGQHGFTQAHYNLLTEPWATVIGPVHPDDEARRG